MEKPMKNFLSLLFFLSFSTVNAQIHFGVEEKDFSKTNIGRIHTGHNEIILTFDDGPVPGVTDKVLDILSEYDIKATFFVIGSNVLAHPNLMKRIVDEGHIVGNHSMNHLPLKNLDPERWREIVSSEVIDAHTAIMPYLANNRRYFFRAPEGSWAEKYAVFLNENEIGRDYVGPILWDIGGEIEMKNGKYIQAADWACWSKKISISDCMSGYLAEAGRKKGGVVLMHDLRHQSVEMLSRLIPELEDRGFTFSTLNDVDWK